MLSSLTSSEYVSLSCQPSGANEFCLSKEDEINNYFFSFYLLLFFVYSILFVHLFFYPEQHDYFFILSAVLMRLGQVLLRKLATAHGPSSASLSTPCSWRWETPGRVRYNVARQKFDAAMQGALSLVRIGYC